MARIRVPLNNFAFGEISPSLVSRTDSPVYQQAAESVKNMFIRAEGGVISRPGTKRLYNFANTVDTTQNQEIRLEPFIFSDDEKYIVAISSGKLDVFRIHPTTGAVTLAQSLTTDDGGSALPWTTAYVPQLTYAQKGDFMWLCHRTFMPRLLVRTGLTSFEVRTFSFDTSRDGNRVFQPYYNFQASGTTITPGATSGSTTLTTNSSYFTSDHVGVRLLIGETEALITGFTSATQVTATLKGTLETQLDVDALRTTKDSNKIEVTHALHGLASGSAITIVQAGGLGGVSSSNINGSRTISRIIDENHYEITAGATATDTAHGGGSPRIRSTAAVTEWFEQSYSARNGFPAAVTFHEDRLWYGGTPAQPDGLWASKTGKFFNFDVGEGEDADGIDVDISTGVVNTIRHLVSNRDLQVFCSQGEFFIPAFQDKPLTPANIKVSSQTPFGSGFVRPQSLDGATLFVQGTGTAVREYIFADSEGAYVGNMVSILSSHLINDPVQFATVKGSLSRPGAYGFFLNSDGKLAVFYSIRAEKRAGWVEWTTAGEWHSVCAVDEDLFAVSMRDSGDGTNRYYLEQFHTDMKMDFAVDLTGTAGVFGVIGHFTNGASVDVVDDTDYLGAFTVASLDVDVSAVNNTITSVQAGYKFTPEIKTLPLDGIVPGGPLTGSPRKISSVVLDLKDTLSVSVNGKDMIIRNVTDDLSQDRKAVTGKEEFRVLGYSRDPRVTVSQSAPLKLQVNGMVIEVAF